MKPKTCIDNNCLGGEHCEACINRSALAKAGYSLIQKIECIPASTEQTAAVNAAEEFIRLAESMISK